MKICKIRVYFNRKHPKSSRKYSKEPSHYNRVKIRAKTHKVTTKIRITKRGKAEDVKIFVPTTKSKKKREISAKIVHRCE